MEEVVDAEVIQPAEGIAENLPENGGITAFIVIKRPSGDWYATADLSTSMVVDREATLDDIKHGCQDIVDSMFQTTIALQVVEMLNQGQQKED